MGAHAERLQQTPPEMDRAFQALGCTLRTGHSQRPATPWACTVGPRHAWWCTLGMRGHSGLHALGAHSGLHALGVGTLGCIHLDMGV